MNNVVKLSSLMLVLSLLYTPVHASECDNTKHDIIINAPTEKMEIMTCEGILTAIDYFKTELGYDDTYVIDMTIQDTVTINMGEEDIQVFGLYNGDENKAYISTYGTDYMNGRTAFLSINSDFSSGLLIDEVLWTSVVTHETAHQLLQQLWLKSELGKKKSSLGVILGHGVHEYIAYTVQIDTLPDEYKERVVAQYPNLRAFENKMNLNSFIHYFFPHKYGVMSFLGKDIELMKDVIEGRFDADAGMINF